MGRSVDDGLDAHVDARQPLAIAHICRINRRRLVVWVVVALSGVRGVGGAEGGGQGAGVGGGVTLRGSGRSDVICVMLVGVVAADGAHVVSGGAVVPAYRVPAAVARVRGRARPGAAIRRVELVIYWCQNTDAGNAAVVVIPMLLHRRMACLQALAPRC